MSKTVQISPLAIALLQNIDPNKSKKMNSVSVNEANTPHHTPASPIKDDEKLRQAKEWFLNQPQRFKANNLNIRNYLLFTIGVNLGRRFSDTRNMRFCDFLHPDNTFKDYLELKEKKTSKFARIYINDAVKEALTLYMSKNKSFKYDDYLFVSRQTKVRNKDEVDPRLSNRRVNDIYQQMAKEIGLLGHISTHSTRKTTVYRMIKSKPNDTRTLMNVQKFLNHRDFGTTLRYAGIEQEEIDTLTQAVNI